MREVEFWKSSDTVRIMDVNPPKNFSPECFAAGLPAIIRVWRGNEEEFFVLDQNKEIEIIKTECDYILVIKVIIDDALCTVINMNEKRETLISARRVFRCYGNIMEWSNVPEYIKDRISDDIVAAELLFGCEIRRVYYCGNDIAREVVLC